MKKNRRETLAIVAGAVVIGVGAFGIAMETALESQPDIAQPDFMLSSATVITAWSAVTVGTLTPINAPAGAYFMLVETSAASGDETGLAVVNG